MTPKKMLLQITTWSMQGNFRKVYQTLSGLPPARRTPELDWYLAVACLRLSDNENWQESHRMASQARDLLLSLPEERREQWDWLLTYGSTLMYLGREEEALIYLEEAERKNPGNEQIRSVLEWARDCTGDYSGPDTFRTRVVLAWQSFLAVEPRLRELVEQPRSDSATEEIGSLLEDALDPILTPPQMFGFNSENGRCQLILPLHRNMPNLFRLRYFRAQAPASVLQHWDIVLGTGPQKTFSAQEYGICMESGDVRIRIDRVDGTAVWLSFYCPSLLPLIRRYGKRSPEVGEFVSAALTGILGEVAFMGLTLHVSMATSGSGNSFSPLQDLPDLLERKGIVLIQDIEKLLAQDCETYASPSDLIPATGDRSDILQGSTACPDLLRQYASGSSEMTDAWGDNSILAGFLWFSREGLDREGEDRMAWDLLEQLTQHLNETAGPEAIQSLGWAMGAQRVCLDLLAWDYRTLLQEAVLFFQDHPVTQAAFQCFSTRPPFWITGGEDQEEDGEDEEEDSGS